MLGLGGLCHEAAGRQPAPPAHNVVTSNVLSKAQGGTSRPQPEPEARPTWPSASSHALLQVGLWSKLRKGGPRPQLQEAENGQPSPTGTRNN